MSEACKTRLFSPLPRNKSAPFSHALGCLSAGNPLPTVRAVFDAVRGGRKERAAHGTFLSVLGLIEFRIEQLRIIKPTKTVQTPTAGVLFLWVCRDSRKAAQGVQPLVAAKPPIGARGKFPVRR